MPDVRTILITGTSSGIGRHAALTFDGLGHRVFAGVRRTADGDALKAEASSRLTPLQLDVTDAQSLRAAHALVTQALNGAPLHGLVNNAGMNIGGVLEFLEPKKLRELFEVNVFGVLAVTQQFLPLLRESRGRVVNISSAAATLPTHFGGAYSASKIALEALTHGLRRELRPWGIFASVVRPGATDSAIWQKTAVDPAKWELSSSALSLYSGKLSSYVKAAEKMKARVVAPNKVVAAIGHGLFSPRPKATYLVGAEAWAAYLTSQLVPDWLVDAVTDAII